MNIFIGADHRGFELKNQLIEYLQEKNIRVEDMGNYQFDAQDDYPDYSRKVAQAVQQNPNHLGIVICGSGIGVCMSANRFKGIRCALGFTVDQVKHGRENDHVNTLALPSDYVSFEDAKKIVDAFLEAKPNMAEKYLRRAKKVDQDGIGQPFTP